MISPSISQNLECSPTSVRKSSVCEVSGAGSRRPIFTRRRPRGDQGAQFRWFFRMRFFSAHKFSHPRVTGQSSHCDKCLFRVHVFSVFFGLNEKMPQRGFSFSKRTQTFFTSDQQENALPDTHVQHTRTEISREHNRETGLPKAHCK